MIIFKSINRLNKEVNFKANIGFVPTMGALHKGHISLIKSSKKICKKTLVSIFINPSQFNKANDFKNYPKNLKKDIAILKKLKVDYLLAPKVKEIYRNKKNSKIKLKKKDKVMCALYRPGHFEGVLAVINQFLIKIKPKHIFFGEKDYQQLSIIRKLVHDLKFETNIVAVGTVRDDDGLALSSRNMYLNEDERKLAPLLFDTLAHCRDAIASGFDNFLELESHARFKLIESGFSLDYFTILDAQTLSEITEDTKEISILVAARLGETRLIDNVRISVNTATDWGILAAQ